MAGDERDLKFLVPYGEAEAFARLKKTLAALEYGIESDGTDLWCSVYNGGKRRRRIVAKFSPGAEGGTLLELIGHKDRFLGADPYDDLLYARAWLTERRLLHGDPPIEPSPPFLPISAFISPYPRHPAKASEHAAQTEVVAPNPVVAYTQKHRFFANGNHAQVLGKVRAFADFMGYREVASGKGMLFVRGDRPGDADHPNVGQWQSELQVKVYVEPTGQIRVSMTQLIWHRLGKLQFQMLKRILYVEFDQMRDYVSIGAAPLYDPRPVYKSVKIKKLSDRTLARRRTIAYYLVGIASIAVIALLIIQKEPAVVVLYVGATALTLATEAYERGVTYDFSTPGMQEEMKLDSAKFMHRTPPAPE